MANPGGGFPATSKFGKFTDTYTAAEMGLGSDITVRKHSMPVGLVIEEDYGEYKLVKNGSGASIAANLAVVATSTDGNTVAATGAATDGLAGVTMAAIADGEYGWIRTRGVAQAKIADTTAAKAAICPSAVSGVLATPANTVVNAIRAYALEANSTGAAAVKAVQLH